MKEHTYPGSYESHLRRRVKELEAENERLNNLLQDATDIAIEALNARSDQWTMLRVPASFNAYHDPETGLINLQPKE